MSDVTKKDIESAFEEAVKLDRYCSLGKVIAEHEHGATIKAKVDDEVTYSSRVISRVLKNLGIGSFGIETIQKHRKKDCRCVPVGAKK